MKIIERFKEHIHEAQNILISTHIIPDADGIGSQIALCMALRVLGKNAICVNEEKLLERYKYLDPDDVIISLDEYLHAKEFEHFHQVSNKNQIDLFIVADTNSLERIGAGMKQLASTAKKTLFVDHHPCAKSIVEKNCIDTTKAATGELAGELILALNVPMTSKMALPLYTAIIIDTSSFRYPTVTGNTHRIVAGLMDTGLEPPQAYNMIYGTKKLTYMKLLGKVLTSADTTDDEKVAWIVLSEELLEEFHVDSEDTLAFVNHLLILDNIKVALMFREMGSEIKVSLRSVGIIDVGEIARALGGGGHDHSAAAMIKGPLDQVIKETVEKVHALLLLASA